MSLLSTNSVKLPISEAAVSQYWDAHVAPSTRLMDRGTGGTHGGTGGEVPTGGTAGSEGDTASAGAAPAGGAGPTGGVTTTDGSVAQGTGGSSLVGAGGASESGGAAGFSNRGPGDAASEVTGCTCRTSESSGHRGAWLALVGLLGLRRRRGNAQSTDQFAQGRKHLQWRCDRSIRTRP